MDINNINTDRDTSGLGPIEYDQTKVPALIRKHANNVRTKTYGQEMREAQARNAELAGLIASEASLKVDEQDAKIDGLDVRFDNAISGVTVDSEVIDSRVAGTTVYPTLKGRLDFADEKILDTFENLKKVDSPNIYAGPVFSLIDDDASEQFKTILKPVLDARNLKATLAVVSERVGTDGSLSLQELQELQDDGFEIVSHSTTHENIYANDNESADYVEATMKDSQEWLMQNGFKGYETFVLPYGSITTRNKNIARKYYKNVLKSWGGGILEFPYDNMEMPRQGIRLTDDFETVLKPVIDETIAKNGWLVFLTHSGYEISSELMNTVLDYISGYKFTTFSEGLKLKGNALSIGDFKDQNKLFVSNSGKIKGQAAAIGLPVGSEDNLDLITPDKYDDFTMTIQNVDFRAVQASVLGGSEGGYLLTYKNTEYYIHQIFIAQTKAYIRRWDRTNSVWYGWNELLTSTSPTFLNSKTQEIEDQAIGQWSSRKITDPMSAYTQGKTMIHKVGTGYGVESKAGILETVNLGDYHSFQRFTAADGQLYTRYWAGTISGGAFTTWKKYSFTEI